MRFLVLGLALYVMMLTAALAEPRHWNEGDWVDATCGGVVEHVNMDNTRVDCLTKETAYEYDWAKKWAEAIGQALHYSLQTGKRGGVRLILRDATECKYVYRVREINDEYDLNLRIETVGAHQCGSTFNLHVE